jgi:hypothetical protein
MKCFVSRRTEGNLRQRCSSRSFHGRK